MTERRLSAEKRRRLEREGFELEITPSGKHYWREPLSGRRLSPPHAAHLMRRKEERTLEEAGWEPVEEAGEGRYWRRPDTGRLYPRGAAYDLLKAAEEEE